LARRNDDVSLLAAVFDDVAQDGDVLLAIGSNAILFPGAPPRYRLQAIAALGGFERFFRELIELDAVAEQLVQVLVHVEGTLAHSFYGRVRAKHFDVEPVAVERNDVRELFELGHELFRIRFEPAAEAVVLVPRYRDGESERGDVPPAALDFVREPQRFDIQINLPIEESRRVSFSSVK
jgi:hypothetical protein